MSLAQRIRRFFCRHQFRDSRTVLVREAVPYLARRTACMECGAVLGMEALR